VRSVLKHFIFGQATSAIFGVTVTVILVREMSIPDYAAYAVLLGIALMIGSLSSLAIEQTSQRFLPEYLVRKEYGQLFSLTCTAVFVRSMSLFLVVLLFYIFETDIVEFFSINIAEHTFNLWLLATMLVISYRFLNVLQQVFLQHKIIKWIGIGLNALRFMAVIGQLWVYKEISLLDLVWIEIYAHSISVFLSAIYLFRAVYMMAGKKLHRLRLAYVNKRIASYIGYSFVREVLYMFSGHAMNRLVIGKYMVLSGVAAFGFAQSLMEFASRYTPSILLNNMIQPVIMGRHAEKQDDQRLLGMAEFILRLNLLMLIPLVFIVLLVGESGSNYITSGKYPDAGYYLSGLIVILIFQSRLYFLQLLASANELVQPLMHGAVIAALFLIPIIFLVYEYGVWGLIAGKLVQMFIRDRYIANYLRHRGVACDSGMIANVKLFMCALVPFVILSVLELKLDSGLMLLSIVAGYCAMFLTTVYFVMPFNVYERELVVRLLKK